MLLSEVLGCVFGSGDGVCSGATLDLAVDAGEVVEAPKDVSRCVEKTQ
jgi:hypothetical protein